MATTYTQLVATLRSLYVTDESDTDFAAILPRAIEAAELRIASELEPVALLATAQQGLTANQPQVALPADFVAPRSFVVYAPQGGPRRAELLRRDSRFLAEYWPDATALGVPKYWAELNFSTVQLAPTPDAAYVLELQYIARPAGLSQSNQQTWVSVNVPDLLEYACMCWLAMYGKQYGSSESVGSWEAQYARSLAQHKRLDLQRRGLADVPLGLKPQ
jgi:hypothetical protein